MLRCHIAHNRADGPLQDNRTERWARYETCREVPILYLKERMARYNRTADGPLRDIYVLQRKGADGRL